MKPRYSTPRHRKSRCSNCGKWEFASVCTLCKEPRAAFGLLLKLTRSARIVPLIKAKLR